MLLRLLLCFFLAAALGPARAAALRIDTALTADGDSARFPAGAPLRSVSLPDDWSRSRPGSSGPVWYRVSFEAFGTPQNGDLAALYVEHVCTNLEVFLNGKLVHSGGRMEEPLTHNCNHPQLVPLPAGLINPGQNLIDIKVVGYRLAQVGSRTRAGGISELYTGAQSELQWRYARQNTINIALPEAVGATLLLMGSFMFVLGFINRRESYLAYFGALSIGWAVIDARLWLSVLPISNAAAEFLVGTMLSFITLAAIQFLLRYAKLRIRFVDRGLFVQCAAMALGLFIAGPNRLHQSVGFWQALFACELFAAALLHLQVLRREESPSFWPMAAGLATLALAGAIELAGQQRGTEPLLAHLAHLVPPVMFVLLGLRLVQQHGRALQASELDRAQLELRVREATAEIERNFQQLAELRVEQVTERERKRIAADLHDDLGAKLLTIVHTSESDRISTLAREALEEMRLSVRGLTGRAVRLCDALGDWRAEVVSRLAQAGIEAEWTAPEDLPQMLPARAFVQTTRILREATSNIIKHSKASRCSIVCRVVDGDFQAVVQDNGEGIPLELEG
ncbi:MAG: sensor histidine kinase, partial [Burkholderiales bacterium]|nr:sensor histidine kinase [Burkholderiales bacterium]